MKVAPGIGLFAAAALVVLAATAAGLFLWVGRERQEMRLELFFAGSGRSVVLDGPEDVRPAVLPAIPVDLPLLPAPVLTVAYELHSEWKVWNWGLPPWTSTQTSTWSVSFTLRYDPGPPAAWSVDLPFIEPGRPTTREEAVDLLLRAVEDYCRGKTT